MKRDDLIYSEGHLGKVRFLEVSTVLGGNDADENRGRGKFKSCMKVMSEIKVKK